MYWTKYQVQWRYHEVTLGTIRCEEIVRDKEVVGDISRYKDITISFQFKEKCDIFLVNI